MSDAWKKSSIQFPRLIAEINAMGLTREQTETLCNSMDINKEQLYDLFERAHILFEIEKSNVLEREEVYIDCINCDQGVLVMGEVDENNVLTCTCPSCDTELCIDENGITWEQK